jgi:hypothetical protein
MRGDIVLGVRAVCRWEGDATYRTGRIEDFEDNGGDRASCGKPFAPRPTLNIFVSASTIRL